MANISMKCPCGETIQVLSSKHDDASWISCDNCKRDVGPYAYFTQDKVLLDAFHVKYQEDIRKARLAEH